MAETCMASNFDFPRDDLVQLSVAFSMLGKHRFGQAWDAAGDLTIAARIGQSRRHSPEILAMARWANKAIVQCVRNGWLPVIYFEGDRRFRYFDNPNGREVRRVHIRPIDHDERGQVEFADGYTAFCVADVSGFLDVVKEKFGVRAEYTPGPKRKFLECDAALDELLREMPSACPTSEIIRALNKKLKTKLPEKTTLYQRIDEARTRALDIR